MTDYYKRQQRRGEDGMEALIGVGCLVSAVLLVAHFFGWV